MCSLWFQYLKYLFRISHPEVFCRKDFLKNFPKIHKKISVPTVAASVGLMFSHITVAIAPRKSLIFTRLFWESNFSPIPVSIESPQCKNSYRPFIWVVITVFGCLFDRWHICHFIFLFDISCRFKFYIFCMIFSSNFVKMF